MQPPLNAFLLPAGIIVGMASSALFSFALRQRRRSHALPQIEGRIDRLLAAAGIEYDPYAGVPHGVAQAIRRGKAIEAIRLYRESSGAGLKEAKDFIDGLISPENQLVKKLDLLLNKAGFP